MNLNSISIQKLKYVVTIAERGSFHKAAQVLYISQPSLSSAIRELEDELKLTLFTRTNRGVQLTKEGLEFLPYARQVLSTIQFIEERFVWTDFYIPDRLSIVSNHTAIASVAFAAHNLKKQSRYFDFHFHELTTVECVDVVSHGTADIGVLTSNAEALPTIKNLLSTHGLSLNVIADFQPSLFLRKGTALDNCASIKFSFNSEELKDIPFVGYYQGEGGLIEYIEEYVDLSSSKPIRSKQNVFVNDRAAKLDMVMNGCYTTGLRFFNPALSEFITRIPIETSQRMTLYWIKPNSSVLSEPETQYITSLTAAAKSWF